VASWNGKSGTRDVRPGVYLVHYEAGGVTMARRIVVAR
jgi:hypothetical protein